MTMKQDIAFKKVVENGGNVSKAMREAGYSPATAKNPKKLTESDRWKQLLETFLPDERLILVNSDGLEATRPSNAALLITKDGKVEKAEEQGLIEVPDYAVRHKYLETALKLKRRLGNEPLGQSTNVQVNVQLDGYMETVDAAD